jgi:hypothetical protein
VVRRVVSLLNCGKTGADDIDVRRCRTATLQNQPFSSPPFYKLVILCYCTAAHLLRLVNVSNELPTTAEAQAYHTERGSSRVSSDGCFASPVTRPRCRPYRRSISFTSGFPLSTPECPLLVRVRRINHTSVSSFCGGLYQLQKHFRLLAGTDGCAERANRSCEKWLAIQEHVHQMSDGVTSIYESALIRKLLQCRFGY